MKPKFLLPLALAVGCGLIATVGVSQIMEQNARGVSLETAPIYVALHNINVGDPIDSSMVSLQEWPKDKIPQGALTELADIQGRRPRTNIIAGETILEGKLLGDDEYADPISQIAPGMRLSTIAVDAETSAAGLLSPGDRVDVQWYASRDERSGILTPTTKIILQDVRVFAIEQAVQRAADTGEARTVPKTVSLEVTPRQAQTIDLAQNHGELSLIPRSPTDDDTAAVAEVTLDDILSGGHEKNSREKEQGVARVERTDKQDGGFFGNLGDSRINGDDYKPPFEMEILRASDRSTVEFDSSTGKPLRVSGDDKSYVSSPAGGSGSRGSGTAPAPPTGGGEPDDFPIDFGS